MIENQIINAVLIDILMGRVTHCTLMPECLIRNFKDGTVKRDDRLILRRAKSVEGILTQREILLYDFLLAIKDCKVSNRIPVSMGLAM